MQLLIAAMDLIVLDSMCFGINLTGINHLVHENSIRKTASSGIERVK